MAARRDADERLDVVLKHSLQDEAVINRKTPKSIKVADWNSVPHWLRIEKICCIPISGNTGVEIKHFDAVSERECRGINLKVPGMYAQKHSFVIIFMPNRKPQNHFFWNTTRVRRKRWLDPNSKVFTVELPRYNKQNGRKKIHFHV